MVDSVVARRRSSFLQYALPSIGEEEIDEVADSLRSGWITTGPKVKRFEEDFAAYVGARHAIAVSSCTAALHIALAALDVGPGDEVIVPTLTFCATANVVLHLGATPVLVDVNDDGHISIEAVERAISAKTRVIMPVHYAGQACNLDPILALAARNGIRVVEDAAHAVGSTYAGRKIGSHECIAAFSFYAIKNMTTGEGGMITTADGDLAARMRLLSLHGLSRDAWKRYTQAGSWYYEVVEPGYKYNMMDIQAALGIHQLRRLDCFIERRQELAALYHAELSGVPGLQLPRELPERNHVYHLYPVRLDESVPISRDCFIEKLKEANIGASVHFIPLHRHPLFERRYGYLRKEFPIAESFYAGLLSLPLYPRMTDEDANDVVHAVQEIMAGC